MTKPKKCAVAYCLPTSQEGFEWSQEQAHSHYVKRFVAAGWNQYAGTCSDLRCGIEVYNACGVLNIHEQLRTEQWPTVFGEGSVVILFAHWVTQPDAPMNATVEFWDTRLPLQMFVDGIPQTFSICRCVIRRTWLT
jgi:hypothetical protein